MTSQGQHSRFPLNDTGAVPEIASFSSYARVFLFSAEKVLDSCSFRDEDDDCTYHYTVDKPKDLSSKDIEVQVLNKKGELQVGC